MKPAELASADDYLSITKRAPEALLKRLALDAAGQLHATPFARMRLRNEITEAQYAVGNWFAQLEHEYRRAIGSPGGIRTSTGERITKSHPPDPFSATGWNIAASERSAVRKFESARMAGMESGRVRFKHFWFVVVDGGMPVGYVATKAVQEVCSALDKHRSRNWKSGGKGKKGRS